MRMSSIVMIIMMMLAALPNTYAIVSYTAADKPVSRKYVT
jgi:hypothetical protein